MRHSWTLSGLAVVMVLGGCTVVGSEDSGNPFASGNPMTSANPPTSGTPDTEGTDDQGSDEADQTTDPGDESTSNNDTATTTGPPPTTTNMTMDDSTSTTDDPPPPDGMQPDDGMYSACTVPDDCGFSPNVCVTLSTEGGMLIGGFCTETGCGNPAADCNPTPGGTATPTCIGITVNMMAESVCALDCSGGATCPPPMECEPVMGAPDLCV